MATIGYATMAVIPSLRGVTAEMNKQISGPMTEAGKKAGNQLGQGIASGVEQAKAKVEKASSDVAKARAAEKDAADKVHVAEQKLLALRNRGVTDVGRLADAEAKVNKAKRDSEIRSNATATADRNLARARQDVTTASRTGAQSVQQFGDAANRSSGGLSAIKTAAPLAAAGIAAVAAAAISAGKFIGEIGTTFNEMRSKMQLATGAGTETLNKLNESVKNVAKGSPAAIGTIAERMTILYQRTGLTGETLETLTKQVNKAGAALGQDLDLKQLTGTMATFGVKGTEISGVLDDIFRVSRNTGMGMNEIISAAKTAAPSLQEFGFSLSDSAALIGSLDKAGVDASSVLATFGRGLVNVAKAGQSPKQAFADVTTQIQGFIQQGNIAGAVNVAGKIFGTRGAVQFVNAVKSGAVSMDQLTNSAAKQGDSILDAEGATVTWAKTWGLFKNNVIIALEPLATRFFNVFIEGMTWLRTNGVVAIQFLSSVFTPVFDAISPLAERIFPLLGTAITTVAGVISEFAQKALAAAEFVNRNRAAFIAVAGVITALFLPALVSMGITMAANAATMGVMAAGMTAYNIATKAISIATRAWAAAQWALNAAFVGNPLGIAIAAIVAIGAAIFLAYKKSETFRNIVQSVWQWVQRAGSAIMGGLVAAFKWVKDAISPVIGFVKRFWQILVFGLGPIGIIVGVVTQLIKHWDLVKAAFSAVGAAAMWLWNTVIVPAFNGIKAAIGIWWTGVQIYFNAWKTAITWVGQAAMWLWNNAIKPAWDGIVAAGQFLWSGVSTIFEWFKAGISVLGDVVRTVVNSTIVPLWNAVKVGAEFMWGGIKTVFDWIKSGWDLLGKGIQVVVDSIIKPAFEGVKTALGAVGSFFGTIVDGIKTAWDKLKGYVATPINFVINTIWNNGLLKAWNTIAGFLPGLKQMSPLNPVAFRTGGPVPMMPGATRGQDSVHALMMPGEHVWDVADVRKSGGQGAQYRMRDMIEKGKPFTWTPNGVAAAGEGGLLPRFEDGGAVNAGDKLAPLGGEGGLQPIAVLMRRIIFKLWKNIKEIGGYRAQDKYPEHPSGRALDVMVPDFKTGDQVNQWTHANAPKFPIEHTLWRQRYRPMGNINGTPMEDRGSPTQNHMDHVHTWYKPQNVDPNVVPSGLVGKGGGPSDAEMLAIIRKKISEILDKALNPVKQGMASVIGSPPPEWLGIPAKALDETKNKALDAALAVAMKLGDKLEAAYNKAKSVVKTATNIVTAPARSVIGLFRDQGGFVPTGNSIVTNETGKPEAVLNWQQLNSVKDMMDKGASLSQAVAKVGAAKPKSDEIPADAVVLKHNATVQDVAQAISQLKSRQEGSSPSITTTNSDPTKPGQTPTPGQPDTNELGQSAQPKNQLKSFKELGQEAGGLVAEGIANFFDLPSWITDPGNALQGDKGENVRRGQESGNNNSTTDNTTNNNTDDPKYGDGSTINQGETGLTPMPDLTGPKTGWERYPFAITRAAKDMGLIKRAAVIGNAAALVEVGDPMKMYANSKVPESLKYPHDAVGSDGTSVGLFQQQQNGAWGTLAENMDPYKSAKLFYNALKGVSGWETMDMGAAAQAVQRSGYPGRYGPKMGRAEELVNNTRLFDTGGMWMPGQLGYNGLKEPEMVLRQEHWNSVADQTHAVRELVGAGGGRTTNITVYGHTAGDIAQEIDRKQWRGSGGYGSRVR